MRKEFVDYICSLHGYLIRLKEIHWNTDYNSEHTLCDEISDELADCEDRFAEAAMGLDAKHFRIGDLKPLLPNSEKLLAMLKELEGETIVLEGKLTGKKEAGLVNVLDDILECCNKYKYRSTQCGSKDR